MEPTFTRGEGHLCEKTVKKDNCLSPLELPTLHKQKQLLGASHIHTLAHEAFLLQIVPCIYDFNAVRRTPPDSENN